MAPSLRSGRRTGHPKVVLGAGGGAEPGGCSPRRTDAGGEGRCLRTRWRAGAAGMLANCLLSVGMLLLLVRCALAAEEKPTYDASGSSSLQSDPAATAAPAHPLADPSVAEEVPFSVVHSDGDSESGGEGLSGQPAFSSVLTVMAGTVKHPVSLDHSRTSPTITRDETHTTQWPSHSSSQGSEMSSSLSSVGDKTLPASSGLRSITSHQHTTQPQASTVSQPSHFSFTDGNRNVSSFSSSAPSLSESVSQSSPSTSTVLSSVVSLLPLLSSHSQRVVSSPRSKTETVPPPATTTHSAVHLTTVKQELQSTTAYFVGETSVAKHSGLTKHSFYTPADKIHGVSETYKRSASTKVIKTPATSTYASFSTPKYGQNLLNVLYRPTQTKTPLMNSVSANNLEISTSLFSNHKSQAVQRQQGALQTSTSALLSAYPNIYSDSGHVTQQMLNQTADADSQTFVHKITGDAIMSPLNSHVVNPTVSPAMMLRPSGSFFTVSSQTQPGKTSPSTITEVTPVYSGTMSSEHASSPGDLPTAAGHGSPRVPPRNINYNQGEIAEAEMKSISAQAHLNNSLSLTQPRLESTTSSILSSITRTSTSSSTSESDLLHLFSNPVINIQALLTQTGSHRGITQEPPGWSMPEKKFPDISRTMSLSGSALPAGLTNDITYKITQTANLSPLFLSHSSNHNNADHSSDMYANNEVSFADKDKTSLSSQNTPSQRPYQTRSVPLPVKSYQTVSLAGISAQTMTSERAGYSEPSIFVVETSAGNSKTSQVSSVKMTYVNGLKETSVSPLLDRNKESIPIKDNAFNNEGVQPTLFTTQFPSFTTTKNVFVLNKGSEGSGKGAPTEIPQPSDAELETLKSLSHKDAVTVMGGDKQSTPSSWSEIILTPRTNSASHSQDSITVVRSNAVINTEKFQTQTGSPKGTSQEPAGWSTEKKAFPFNSRTFSPDASVLPVGSAKDITYEITQIANLPTMSPSHNLNNTYHSTSLSAHREVNFANQAKTSSQSITTQGLPLKASAPHSRGSITANRVINAQEFTTQTLSPSSETQEPIGWLTPKVIFPSSNSTLLLSGSALLGRLAKHITHNTTPSVPSPKHKNPDYNIDPAMAHLPITPSQKLFQTRSLLTIANFYTASGPPPIKSDQTAFSTSVMKSKRAGYSITSTSEVETSGRNSKTSPESDVQMTYGNSATSFLRDATKSSVSSLFARNEESTSIKDSAFNREGVPSVPFTTQSPSFTTTKNFFVLIKGSESSGKDAPTETTLPSDAELETLKGLSHNNNAPLMGRYDQSTPSSWSEIILTVSANSASHSQGSITTVRNDKSNIYSGRQTTISYSAASAANASSSGGQNSSETISAIFSPGTKIMAPYTKWKPTKPVPFQSTASELVNTSTGFDRVKSNLQADGLSYEHPELEDRQERNVHILNFTDPTVVASDPHSLYPNVGERPSFPYVKGTSGYEEQSVNLSPANLRSAVTINAQQEATVNTAAPSAQEPLSHITADSLMSSQASSLALVYESRHSPSLADVDSPESAFDAAVTLSNNLESNYTETIKINDLKLSDSTLLPSSFPSPSSTSGTSSPPYSSTEASASSRASSSSLFSLSLALHSGAAKPTMHPTTASSFVSVPTPSPSSSPTLNPSIESEEVTETFVVLSETGTDELTAGTSRADALTLPKEKVASLAPSQSVRITLSAGPTERTSQVSPLPPRQDTTTASVKLTTTTVASTTRTKSPTTTTPSPSVTTGTTQLTTTTTTLQPTPLTRRTTTTTTIRTHTSRRTFAPPVPRTSPPRGGTPIFLSPFTTTTEAPPAQCNITERLWVKTVVSIYVRRNRLDSIQRQNLRRGLSQGLRKALNDSSAQAQVETVFGSPNMTVAYHVTGGDIVYPPSVVLEGLDSYGRDRLIADLRQYLPMVTALPLPVALWRPSPATGFQLKTVLQFVGAGDDPRSCRFSQMMEQRLEKVFSEAQAKVLNSNSRLSVQMLSVSQAAASPAVSLVYTVRNGTVFLNGTTASNLLGQLSAELVGYFLFYPPLIIAEPMEYHNLNTSIATRDFWVITVIQDVDNASLEGQYQSFASLMEQRLAELFVLAGQQGTRFRRATAVGSYTVQMVSIRRVSGLKNPAEMTYYVQHNGIPLSGTSAAKVLNTVDSQTMALTLGYFVQLQAEPVVKNPPNNLWIIAAVLAPIAVVTLIIIIITAVLCRKNKNDFKADAIGNLNPRAKMAYRRDVGYYHQPVQGFDYAKQHLGQQGGDEETLPVSQDTLVMSLQIRDTPLSLEKALQQDGTANKKSLTSDKHKSKLPSEDGSVISNESEKPNSGRGLTVLKVTAQQKLTKEETRKRDDPYDTSSGSLQLISIKPVAAQPKYSHPASSDRSQESAIVNGEVNLALKQKSDIEHYRNKLRLKAKRKGYYDFPSTDGSSSGRALAQRQRQGHERAAGEHGRPLEPDDERGSTYVKSHRRHSQVGQTAYRSRQSLSSPSPGGTEMDLLVMRERPRRGIRNSGYDTEPELIEETNVDRLVGPRGYMYGRGLKGHSETSTLSSQPSIDEVRQQMHLLLEEAFSLASGGQSTSGRHSHHHHPPPDHYSHAPPPLPYADVVTSAPGTMSCGRGGLQWVPSYGTDVYQCSLPKPAFHFTQLPEMAVGSPPPLPPRTGPPPGTSLRRSTSDLGPKGRSSETSVTELQSQHDNNPYGPTTRAALPSITAEQPVSNYSGNPITAVYAIPATRPGYSEYFVSTPPTSYHSPSWMSYPPEPEDVPPQWADSLPLPGYVEAFPHPRYPQGSPTRLPLQYNPALEQPPTAPSTASQQSLPPVVKDMDSMPLSSLSTSALVQAIRQEVAKLAKKQNDMFEF